MVSQWATSLVETLPLVESFSIVDTSAIALGGLASLILIMTTVGGLLWRFASAVSSQTSATTANTKALDTLTEEFEKLETNVDKLHDRVERMDRQGTQGVVAALERIERKLP